MPLAELPIVHNGNDVSPYLVLKRVCDLGVSLAVCVVGALPVAAVCVAIRAESPGLPVFRQERVGRHGRVFGMWKLRTMYSDAEENVGNYLSYEQLHEWKTERKVKNDPRITRVGRFLRKTSLDEIPQFVNVLVGDMSVVGPRPVTKDELHWFDDNADEILSVRPGVTGYWQAYARNKATWESGERQNMELYYVRNISFGLDAKIFLSTFSAILGMTGR